MLEQIKANLGENYFDNTDEVLQDIIEDMTSIACHISNRKKDDEELFPYIKKAVRSEYITRGAEGLLSRSEGSISSSYDNIVQKMRNDIVKNHLRKVK